MKAGLLLQLGATLLAPAAPELLSFRAVAWGDSQSGVGVFTQVAAAMRAEDPDLVVGLGDYIQNATVPAEWATLFMQPMGALLSKPRIGCRGNHELPQDFAAIVCNIPLQSGVGQWTAVTTGPVRWLILDANDDSFALRVSMDPGGVQRAFLQRELSSVEWRSARWRVALWHQPQLEALLRYHAQQTRYYAHGDCTGERGHTWAGADCPPCHARALLAKAKVTS